MAQDFRIAVDLSELSKMDALSRVSMFANLSRTVGELAQTGAERWRQAIDSVPGIWQGERDAYKAAIQARPVGPYAWEIENDYKFVEDIETGRPAYDMKRMLSTSLKVRVSKAGKRYLIIPFRHNTPGHTAHAPAMPRNVYAAASELSPSRIVLRTSRRSGTGAYDTATRRPVRVAARKYAWGGRLPAGMTPKLQTHHKTDPHAGMVRMKEASGGSTYMTFRVMVEGSSGWIIKPKPGLFIAKAVAEGLQRTAEVDMGEAMNQDLKDLDAA